MFKKKNNQELYIDNKLIRFWYLARDGKIFWEKGFGIKCRHLIREVFFTTYFVEVIGDENGDTIFFIASPRRDIWEHFYAIYESCDLAKSLVTTNTKREFHIKGLKNMISCFSIFTTNKVFYIDEYDDEANVKASNEIKIPFWGRIYLWSFYSQIISIMQERINKYFYGKKMAVVMNDCMPGEGIFIEMAKKFDIKIVCCQEAMFYDDPNNKIDLPTMYLNQSSDYYIFWGNYTRNLFHKYNRRCHSFICGDPSIKNNVNEFVERWCIICDIPVLHSFNQEMINIVSEVAIKKGKRVDIRLHPQERGKENLYDINDKICKFVVEDFRYEAVFAHTSTMYYTLMAQGIKVFKYLTKYSKVMPSERKMSFSNSDDLEKQISEKSINIRKMDVNEYIAYIDNKAKEKYKEAFREIILLGTFKEI